MQCPFCQNPDVRHKWSKQGYQFFECLACELIFIDPMPSEAEINGFYEKDFFEGQSGVGYPNYATEQAWRSRNYRRDITAIEKWVDGGRLLDIGCATGTFLKVCPDRWEKYGQEVSRYAGAEARKLFGDRIQVAALKEAVYEEVYFDVITMWETLNHMVDPCGDLARLSRLLKRGGVLALSVGDVRSLLARSMGRFWYHVTPPIHLWYVTPKTMTFILDKAGFDVVRIDYLGKHVDLATSLERIRDTTSLTVLTRVCRFLASFRICRSIIYINLFDTMYVFARKR